MSTTKKVKGETFDANLEIRDLIQNNGSKTDKRTTGRSAI